MLIDSHVNLHAPQFAGEMDAVIDRARAAGVGLMVLAVLEFGLGAGRLRTGPGIGLWVELVVGLVVVAAVGMLSRPDDP